MTDHNKLRKEKGGDLTQRYQDTANPMVENAVHAAGLYRARLAETDICATANVIQLSGEYVGLTKEMHDCDRGLQ